MIESIVSAFAKNSFIFSRKGGAGDGDFQQALADHDKQQVQYRQYESNNDEDAYKFQHEDQYKADDYDNSYSYEEGYSSEPLEENTNINEDEVVEGEENKESTKDVDILALLKELGLSEENLKAIQEVIANPEKMPNDEVLNKILADMKASLAKDMPPELLKKVENFSEKFQQLLKEGHKHISKELKQMLAGSTNKAGAEKVALKNAPVEFRNELEGQDKVDNQIKNNNNKHAAMKEIAQDVKNVKFSSEIDPRFNQDTKKSNQAFQARQAQFHAMAAKNSANQQPGTGQQQGKEGGEASLKSPNFIKKMKTILKSNAQNNQTADFSLQQQNKVQNNNAKPSFMNRLSNGQFMQQLVDKIQNMVKANSTLSANVDFKTSEFGDMKLAAEAQGSNLAVKLSNIASNLKGDIASLKSELDDELKNLGFENVELDFGSESDNRSNSNAFEDEMQKRLSGEHVKLPGDHLADLNAISEWMKDYEKVM